MTTQINEIKTKYYPTLESVVQNLFPEEKIISSQQKRVKISSFIKNKNFSSVRSQEALYFYDIIETNRKIFIDKKDPTDSLMYFVIDKDDIEKTEEVIEGGQVLKKITMIPKREYEFKIFNFTNIDPTPADFIARFFYNIQKIIDHTFGNIFTKRITEITY